jgi:hypothetical protein
MDSNRIDALAESLGRGITRRQAFGSFLAAAGVLPWAVDRGWAPAAEAKKKKRKKKKKKPTRVCGGSLPLQCSAPADDPTAICYPSGTHCCSSANGGGACYLGDDCCPPSLDYPGGSCAGPDEVCCSAADGGGSCPLSSPHCCPPSLLEPGGSCTPRGAKCCPFGGYCDPGEDCCPPAPGFPFGYCAPAGECFALTAASSQRRATPVRTGDATARGGRRLAGSSAETSS